jgi:hypothetical protein
MALRYESGRTLGAFKVFLLLLAVVAAIGGYIAWDRGFREHPQPDWVHATPEMRFKYGSLGAENDAGIPYWIFYVLPRMFPEKLPGPGGYASLGVPWEEGQELPIGFTKKTIGFPRVANNCAVCHTATYRTKPDETRIFVVASPGHTTNVEGFFRFLIDCAKDPRFNADNLMSEINLVTKLDLIDKALYRFFVIPITKKRLLEREAQFAWIYRKDFPDWGPGRDDAMNLTKYFMTKQPMDDTFGPTDMPSIWNLQKYKADQGMFMNFAGDSHDAYSVIMDSALGLLGAPPRTSRTFSTRSRGCTSTSRSCRRRSTRLPSTREGRRRQGRVREELRRVPRERPHGHAHSARRDRHRPQSPRLLEQECRGDREQGRDRHGLAAQGTGRGDAQRLHRGLPRRHLAPRAVSAQWSVPTLRDLLEPVGDRPKVFYRGYDVYDPERVGS